MKKVLLIVGILTIVTVKAAFESSLESLLEASKKTDGCDFLLNYSDYYLEYVRHQAIGKAFTSSKRQEIEQVVDFANRIADCRLPMAKRYNPQYFINLMPRIKKN